MAEPAHILFLIDSFFGHTGGAEGALVRIARHLPRERYRCSVITFRTDPARDFGSQFDCPFHLYPLQRTYDWTAFKTALQLRRYIQAEKVDLVHTFFETADVWAAPIAKLSGCRRLISSRRDMGILRHAKHRLLYRLLGPIYDQVQAVSNEVGAFAVREDHLDPARVITVYNGIEPERFASGAVAPASREALGVGDASHVVLSVGNIRRVKGIDVLLETAALVCREFPRARFVVAGNPHEPDYFESLLAQRAELGLDRHVIFLGERTDIAALMAASDVFLLPSRSEGLSNALLEAMASRMAVVATRVGGNAEVVMDGESGYLVESEDPAAMSAALIRILSDPTLARTLGDKGRAIVEARFTVQAMVGRMVEAYDALLAR